MKQSIKCNTIYLLEVSLLRILWTKIELKIINRIINRINIKYMKFSNTLFHKGEGN